jgi:AcrR family transcriptional regulator
MSSPVPQRLPREERRELLLDAATELFATRGYHATDVASIAAKTGVTKVIAYRAFGSKQALYQTLLDRHRDQLLGTIAGSQQLDHANRAERIHAGLDAWLAYVYRHPFAWRLLFRDTTGIAELEEHHREMRANARHVLQALLTQHFGLTPEIAAQTAEFLRSAIVGLALWWLENPQISRGDMLVTAERLVTGALDAVSPHT